MNPFDLSPFAAILDGAHALVLSLTALLDPVAGPASAAAAIVLVTLAVRAVLIPVGVSQRRAELGRRRLAPQLAALRERYARRPELMREKLLELYSREGVSPVAGILPVLAQAPVLSVVYALFTSPVVAGHANALLAAHLWGAQLGVSFVHVLAGSAAWPLLVPFAPVLVVALVAAALARRVARRDLQASAAASGPSSGTALTASLTWLPFVTVVIAAVAPLAAAIYLATTTSWTVVERAVLRRRMPDPASLGS